MSKFISDPYRYSEDEMIDILNNSLVRSISVPHQDVMYISYTSNSLEGEYELVVNCILNVISYFVVDDSQYTELSFRRDFDDCSELILYIIEFLDRNKEIYTHVKRFTDALTRLKLIVI